MDEEQTEQLQPLLPGTLFNTGQLYATAEAIAAMQKYDRDPLSFYRDYVTGSSWGVLETNHIMMAHEAIKNGHAISVAYHLGGLDMLCLSTKPDRSMTTFMMLEPLPEGYDMIDYPTAPLIPNALFNPGILRATQAALDVFQRHNVDYLELLQRFLTGDWESLSEKGNEYKHTAIREGKVVQALYRITDDVTIFVLTKADRSYTSFELWPKFDEDEEHDSKDD
jgi:hypothetical protein